MSFNLPAGWEWLPFEKLLAIPLRNGIYKKKEFHGRGAKIVNMGELFAYPRLKDVDMKRVELTEKELDKSSLQSGDLIFARRSLTAEGAGKCTIVLEVNEPTTFESSIIRARLNRKIANPEFYYYLFNSKFGKWLLGTILRQVAVAGITGSDLAKLEVPVPPLNVQNEVAKHGSSLDDKIELNQQINQTLEQIAQAIFKSWFVNFEPVKAKIQAKQNGQDPERAAIRAISGKTDEELDQLSAEQHQQLTTTATFFPDEIEGSELGEIPFGWKVKKIEECIERFPVGKKFSQKTAFDYGAVPILDQGKSGIIGYHNEKPGVLASPDDPIIVFANHTCYMRIIMYDFSAIQNVLPFKGVDRNIYWTFMSAFGKQSFDEYKGHWPDFIIKQLVEPNNALDEIYGDHVADLFKIFYQKEKENITLADTRDSLLPKLLSGEVEIQAA